MFLPKTLLFPLLAIGPSSTAAANWTENGFSGSASMLTHPSGDRNEIRRSVQETNGTIEILGLVDYTWSWGPELFDFTMNLINDREDGWHDEIFADGTEIGWSVRVENCDGAMALNEYWDFRTRNSGLPPHGLMGCRCSGSSSAVASITGLEGVPQVSPASTAEEFSDKTRFPFFARTVSPDEVLAIIALMRGFGWERVTILQTDTVFASDRSSLFQQLWIGAHEDESGEWEGEIAYTFTISLQDDGSVNEDSVVRALDGVPTDDPRVNSRIILLLAQPQQAFHILRIAEEINFQPDTVWVGPASWAGRYPPNGGTSWIPDFPGYIGVTPYRNKDEHYKDFLDRFNDAQKQLGKEQLVELPDYGAEQMVDSILALTLGLSATSPEERRNGAAVMSSIIDLDFDGVSGRVSFTPEGDRKDPLYTIFNLKEKVWSDVGSVGLGAGSADIHFGEICFSEVSCGTVVADTYPVPPDQLPKWIAPVVSVIVVVLVLVTMCYSYTVIKKKQIQSQMTELQKKMAQMATIDTELGDIDKVMEEAKKRQADLIMKRAALQDTPETWSNSLKTLVPVPPEDEQYWKVFEKMRETIPDVHISMLWRIQNPSLWSFYSFHKDRLEKNKINANERRVWHGTSSLEPSVIYNDQMDGFMMQFAAQGLWGRGIYFADKASYSKHYSFEPPHSSPLASSVERPKAEKGEREMFLTRLLVGKEVKLNQDRSITVPPIDSSTGHKYNTVTGFTAGSQVWIVYENGRAYPEYLVRYYCGSRDDSRSPYESIHEARKSNNFRESAFELNQDTVVIDDDSDTQIRKGNWEFLGESGWTEYNPKDQHMIEQAFQDFTNQISSSSIVVIKGPEWEYEVDVNQMTQTNVQHSSRKQRKIRFKYTG